MNLDNLDAINCLDAAFNALSDMGYLAYQNHLCCQSCAGADLTDKAQSLYDDGPTVNILGAVFYHEQDTAERDLGKPFYLSFGPLEIDGVIFGDDATTIGHEIVRVLTEHGVVTEWDGDPDVRIRVTGYDHKVRLSA